MEQALKLSWFFLHSTVVTNIDQQQQKQQTPAFVPRRQATSMTEHHPSSNSKVHVAAQQVPPPPPPPGAVFGGYAHAGHAASSRPAFLSPPGSQHPSQDVAPDSRDEIGNQPHHQQHPYYSPSATFGVSSSVAAEFSPPRSTVLLRTAPSHDSADDTTNEDYLNAPMPDLPSVPPSSSVQHHAYNNDNHSKNSSPHAHHVSFAPPATYQTHEYDPRVGYQYETYSYQPEPSTSTTYHQHAETRYGETYSSNIDNDYSTQYTSYEGLTVPDDEVTRSDVKFGRGGGTNRHPGNLFFRKLVEDAKPAYMLAKKAQKGDISRSIVSIIRSQGGRWLKLNNLSGLWEDVGNDEAAKKVSQALREGLALKRREALMSSVSTSGSRSKRSIAYPAYLPNSKAKCKAEGGKPRSKQEV